MPSYIYVLCPSHYFSLSLHDALPISDRCQAGIVKTTHRLFIDGFYVMQGFHRFMNSGHCVTSIFLAHFALISTKSPLSISSANCSPFNDKTCFAASLNCSCSSWLMFACRPLANPYMKT